MRPLKSVGFGFFAHYFLKYSNPFPFMWGYLPLIYPFPRRWYMKAHFGQPNVVGLWIQSSDETICSLCVQHRLANQYGHDSHIVFPNIFKIDLSVCVFSLRWVRHCWRKCSYDKLTNLPVVRHICVSIGSDNGLSPIRHQAITWTNSGLLSIGPLETRFSEILIKIRNFWFMKMHLKMSSAKRPLFCWRGCIS